MNVCKMRELYPCCEVLREPFRLSVDMNTQVIRVSILCEYTSCPQGWILRIETLLDLGHMFAYGEIEFYSFFDFLNRMYCGGMILAPQFAGDFWKTQVELAS